MSDRVSGAGLSRLLARHLNPRRLGAVRILAGTATGQALALAAAPVLSRIYTPADFGVFTVIAAVVLALATISALRMELAIPLPREPQVAYSIAALAYCAIGLFTLSAGALLIAFGRPFASAMGEPDLMPWLLLAPLSAAAMAAFMVMNQLAVRQERFGDIGRRNVLQSVVTLLSQIVIGAAGGRPGGLVLGMGLGQAAGAASLVRRSGFRSPQAREGRRRVNLAIALRRYRRFPLILAPSGLLNILGLQLPVVLLAYWYGSQVAGWMGLTQRVLSIPVMLLGVAVAQVYVAELAKAARGSLVNASALFNRVSSKLLVLSLAMLLVLLTAGPTLFEFVFGDQWRASGNYAQALSFALAAQLIASPLSQTLVVLERQVVQATWDAARLLATAGSIAVAALTNQTAITAVWIYGVASAATSIASWLLSKQAINHALARRRDRESGDT